MTGNLRTARGQASDANARPPAEKPFSGITGRLWMSRSVRSFMAAIVCPSAFSREIRLNEGVKMCWIDVYCSLFWCCLGRQAGENKRYFWRGDMVSKAGIVRTMANEQKMIVVNCMFEFLLKRFSQHWYSRIVKGIQAKRKPIKMLLLMNYSISF